MSLEEIRMELEIAGLGMEHVDKLVRICENHGFDAATMDKRLQSWGYAKIFTIYDEPEND